MNPSLHPWTSRLPLPVALLSVLTVFASVAIPMWVIRPFRPQQTTQLAIALAVRGWAPWLTVLCVIACLFVVFWCWNSSRIATRVFLVLSLMFTIAGACFSHVNIFEVMFRPYGTAAFQPANAAHIDPDDKVLAITIAGQSHAFPIRTMGYHHIVNDVIASQPIAVTYCTLCHTGLVWSRILNGQTLTFRLAGINNGNALVRDEQTGTIWQQSTGEAIFGSLKGNRLTLLRSNELTFALWHKEQPTGEVLKPAPQFEPAYDPKNWEENIERTRTVVDTSKTAFPPHELIFGVSVDGQSKAYPVKSILTNRVIEDQIGSTPIVIVTGPDNASIRVFHTPLAKGPPPTFVYPGDPAHAAIMDTATSSLWNFQGCATAGPNVGHCLAEIDAHKSYWFDWINHTPSSKSYKN